MKSITNFPFLLIPRISFFYEDFLLLTEFFPIGRIFFYLGNICMSRATVSSQSSGFWKNSATGISNFQITGQSFINKNCHKSRVSDDIDMKLERVNKLGKRNTATSKKYGDDVLSARCDVFMIFPIHGQFGPICNQTSRCLVRKTYIFIRSSLFRKTENRTKKSQTLLSYFSFDSLKKKSWNQHN